MGHLRGGRPREVGEGGRWWGRRGCRVKGFPPHPAAAPPPSPPPPHRGEGLHWTRLSPNPGRGSHAPRSPAPLRECVPSLVKPPRVWWNGGFAERGSSCHGERGRRGFLTFGEQETGCLGRQRCFKSKGKGHPTKSDSAWATRKHVPAPELPLFRLLKMGGFSLSVRDTKQVASSEGLGFFFCRSVHLGSSSRWDLHSSASFWVCWLLTILLKYQQGIEIAIDLLFTETERI